MDHDPSKPAADGVGAGARAEDPPLRILLAEDARMNQILVANVLAKRGHAVQVAGDGAAAVARTSAEPFDLVLMDVQMPVMDGLEATRRIRALPPPAGQVPIVALTGDADLDQQAACLAAGMQACVPKPIVWDRLVEVIREVTRAHRKEG